jgi:hypothetical protein
MAASKVWPTEPAKAGWSFNKWQKTRIPKELRRHHSPTRRHRNDPERAVARAAAGAPAVVADAVAVAEADRVPVVGVALQADRAAVARAARVRVARAAVDAASAKVVTVMADAATVEASSSRT